MNAVSQSGIISSAGSLFTQARRLVQVGVVLLTVMLLVGTSVGRADAASSALLDLVTMATEDVDATWSEIFADAGVDFYEPDVFLVDDSTESACWTFDTATTYGICSQEDAIYFGAEALDDLEASYGRFAVAVTVAEAYGYHLLNLLGSESEGLEREVQATCLAGFWAVEMEIQGRVDEGASAELVAFYEEYWENGDVLAQGFAIGIETEFADDCLTLTVDDGGDGGYDSGGSETY